MDTRQTGDSYKDWTNYETKSVALRLESDKGHILFACEMATDAWNRAKSSDTLSRREFAIIDLADQLKEYAENMEEEDEAAGLTATPIRSPLGAVNWREIASHFLTAIKDEAGREE